MLAEFDHDPAAAHLVGDGAGRAGAGEGVEHEVAGVVASSIISLEKSFGLRCVKDILVSKKHGTLLFDS